MPRSEGTEKKNYHHGDLKQALLQETVRILREEGDEGLSLRRLASNLGVSRTAPYNHFENKESLLRAVAEDGFMRFEQTMQSVRKKHRGQGGKEITRALVKAYVKFARNNREYYDLMYGGRSWRSNEQSDSLKGVARSILRNDIERLKRGQQRGDIAEQVDAVRYAQMYWGTLHGISRLLLDGVYTDSASVNKLCETTAEMLWRQLDPVSAN